MLIPTKVLSMSLVGVRGSFPRGWGNYISVGDRQQFYSVVNLCYEDLVDAKKLGLIGDTMEADVYTKDGKSFVAFITDKRFPEKCLTPRWWYHERNMFKEEILRKEFPNRDKCLCQYQDSKEKIVDFTSWNYETKIRKGACSSCGTKYEEKF